MPEAAGHEKSPARHLKKRPPGSPGNLSEMRREDVPYGEGIMSDGGKPVNIFKRSRENPILQPVTEDAWQSEAVFNPSPVVSGQTVHLLFRAVSSPQVVSGVEMGI